MNNTHTEIEILHPLEIRILLGIDGEATFDLNRCMSVLSENPSQAHQVVSWLQEHNCIEIDSQWKTTQYELTERGALSAEHGPLEEHLLRALTIRSPQNVIDLTTTLNAEQSQMGSAIGRLIRNNIIAFDDQKRLSFTGEYRTHNHTTEPHTDEQLTFKLPKAVQTIKELLCRAKEAPLLKTDLSSSEQEIIEPLSKKRGVGNALFHISEKTHSLYRWTKHGQNVQQALLKQDKMRNTLVSNLTPDMLQNGTWKNAQFRHFNIHIPPSRVLLGRTSTYSQFLRDAKDKLVALGFSEFDGPLVESEFWNCDALFMPQFHSARNTHDVYCVLNPTHAKEIESQYLDAVAQTHRDGNESGSRGWGYEFDRNFTKRLILRSQGTALSAKQMRNASIPGKYFGIVRCFRYDQIDSTHLSDFYQTEGIVLSENVNLRTLLGLLRTFAVELGGAEEVRFCPGYFPFTEPSIEIFARHPKLGWFELGGAGIFRPEVTQPFGITVPVLAWGLGIDRMALLKLNLNDLRQLFTHDIETVRLQQE